MKLGELIKRLLIAGAIVWVIAMIAFLVQGKYDLLGEVAAAPFLFVWFIITRIATAVEHFASQK